MTFVVATTLLGKLKLIPRRSAYGVVLDEDRLLLVNTSSTGKWSFPGGRCEPGESNPEAAIREVHEETGVRVAVDTPLLEIEHVWYDDTPGESNRQRGMFFRCRPLTTTVTGDGNPDQNDQAETPTWVPLDSLRPDDFQGARGELLRFL